MRLTSGLNGHTRRTAPWLRYGAATAAVAAAVVTGAKAVEPDSTWYKALRKPSWQPPSWVFGAVWTPLYATIAYAAGHALGTTTTPRQRNRLISSLAVNLTLNAGWNWLFFARRSPTAALADTVLLGLSNAQVISRIVRTDKRAACVLAPYAAWCAFAAALNASIVRLNREQLKPSIDINSRARRSGLT
ncbi:tryptophan-rich sensory protein [Streptomyces argyrophyllae]|uniref:Tryptophan-rich sensory protein n=1 Tax=Streptomyces argyrophylli TaxID=2726118 RepID=A0A6M4PT85_9ACTN|nr:TspO/MBR family protein [Streptomyces argyrophyllae]QJS13857.1 tryptophan-rich sensory protein [Streptomyces argyrophyllae]